MDRLSHLDEFFLLDNDLNRAYIVSVVKLDKFQNYEKIRDDIIKLAFARPRLTHRLQKFNAEYYFSKMSAAELETAKKTNFVRNDSIKSYDDIAAFMAKEQGIRDSLDGLQYSFTFVPDYSKDESLIILKLAHCLADGITTMAFTATLDDGGYRPKNFPRLIPKMNTMQKIAFNLMNVVLLPYSMYLALKVVYRKNIPSRIHPKGSKLTGTRKVAIGNAMDMQQIRDELKKKRVSINDYLMVCTQLALSQICTEVPKTQLSVPFTLKDYPASLNEIHIGNDFACLPYEMKFPEVRDMSELKDLVREHKSKVRSLKGVQMSLGFYYMMRYFVPLLRYNMEHAPHVICNNYTTVWSCVPGPLKAWNFGGSKANEVFYIVPGVGRIGCGIGVITYNGKVQATVGCDTSYFADDMHKQYLEKFEYIFKNAIEHI